METNKPRKKLTSAQWILLGFGAVILLGTGVLMLPVSAAAGTATPFLEALFTATSATCVTGLVVFDTATYWSPFGHGVILFLIQIGGLGVVTIAITLLMISGRKIGLAQRSTMQAAISAPGVGGILRMTKRIVLLTLLFELIGAACLAPVFIRHMGVGKGIWYSLFHAVSAFCNAGFDLMGDYSSLTAFSGSLYFCLVVCALILCGGIGFLTWWDVRSHGFRLRRYRMQSKVILFMYLILVLLPAVYFFFFEFSRPVWGDMSLRERVGAALFQSVTCRTAGFNTVELTAVTDSGLLLMILLMLTGGAPGSTAGGMKVTTVMVLFASAAAVFGRRRHGHLFGRRLSEDAAAQAAAILLMYLILFLLGAFVISYVEELPLLPCLFETASAIGTVGLSLGLTPGLGTVSRVVLIFLMFLGRVGGLTLIFAALAPKHPSVSEKPQEVIMVG